MRTFILAAGLGLLLAGPAVAQMGQMGGQGGRPSPANGASTDAFPLGNRGPIIHPHEMKPIPREKFDKAVTAMFGLADSNHDGMVTLGELQAVIDARRETIIRAHFKQVDTDQNGSIDLAEFVAWQKRLGSVADTDCAGYANQDRLVSEILEPPLGDSEQDTAIGFVLEPLSAVMLTRANVHYQPGLTQADLLDYENRRFAAVDTNKDDFLDQEEMKAYLAAHTGRPDGSHRRQDGPNGR